MTEHDDIRRALEELASHPPQRDRKPAVHGRIGAVRRRRQIGGGVAASIATLAAAVVITSLPSGGRLPDDGTLATETAIPTPAPAPAPTPSTVSSPEPEPAPEPEAAATTEAITGRAPVAPASTAVVAPPRVAPAPPPAKDPAVAKPAVPTDPPRTRKSTARPAAQPTSAPQPAPTRTASPSPKPAVSPTPTGSPKAAGSPTAPPSGSPSAGAPASPTPVEMLAVDMTTATATDGSVAPETVVTVRVHGSLYGSLDSVTVWFTELHRVGYSETQARSCQPQNGELQQVDETFTFRTRYRTAGTQKLQAIVTTLGPTCVPGAGEKQWPFSATASIPAGSTLTNGVNAPTLALGPAQVQGSRITVAPSAADSDGYVSTFTINWGSGAVDTYPGGNSANCSATEYGGAFWPEGLGSGVFTSRDLPPGTYTVTVTATTTGCDGADPQTAQQSLVVTVP